MKRPKTSGRCPWATGWPSSEAAGQRRAGRAPLLLVGVLACAGAVGLLVLILLLKTPKGPQAQGVAESQPSRPSASQSEPTSALPDPAAVPPPLGPLPDEQEQALRKEQIEVSRRLRLAFPSSANAAFVMGMTYLELGKTTEAMKHLRESLRLNPRYVHAYDHLGRTAVIRGEHEKAVTLFRKALEIDPKVPGIHFRMARALALLGRFEEAIPAVQKEILISPKAGVNHHLLGEIYLQQKEYDKAIQSLETAIAVQPNLAWAYYGLATTCARLGRRDKSKLYREKFKKLSAKGQKAGRHWREVYDSMKATRQSVAHSHTIAARVYRSRGDDRRAERIWKRAAAIDPKSALCRAELAALYQQKKRFSDALPLYKQLTEIQPRNGVHYLHLGQVNARLNRFQDAESAYKRVTQVAPKRGEGYRALAQLYLQRGRSLPEAKRLASRAVELQPIALNYFVLAVACDKSGDRGGALSAIQQAVRLDPRNAEYRRVHRLIQGRK